MIPFTEDRFGPSAGALAAEDTLRKIASLPAPAGLEDRVKAGLQSAPRRSAVIAWPLPTAEGWMRGVWMRAAAAAVIVLTVAGGGWGVYSSIQIAPIPSAFVEPQLPSGVGRFSTAGAMHVPQTVEGPVVAAPVVEKQKQETGPVSAQRQEKGKVDAGAPRHATQQTAVK